MKATGFLALAATAQATIMGFNYGSTFTTGAAKAQSDFEAEFSRAQTLQGASGFSSARLYTMIQAGTPNTPISAIPAAISTKTGLLLGLWASAGQASFNNELAALSSAINQYGTAFTDLIQGISVGSEDLYRETPTGIENKSGVGASPSDLVNYINQVRSTISGTSASGKPVGHVDTWTAWINGSNSAVINAVDWLGFDGYPYFQTVNSNGIENGKSLFQQSYDATVAVANGKSVWVTETGWPVSGPDSNLAVASTANAKTYWDEVGCGLLFGKINTWWYTIQDAAPTTPSPSFGLVGTDLSSAPVFDLNCPALSSSSSSSAAASSSSAGTTSVASATAPGTTAASTTVSINNAPGVETGSLSVSAGSSAEIGSSMASAGSMTTSPKAGSTSAMESETAETITVTATTYVPLENCPATCVSLPTTLMTASSSPAMMTTSSSPVMMTSSASGPAPASSSATTAAAPSGTSCPTNLNAAYQYPHLIVPVDSSKPNTAFGTSYNGTISPTLSTIFNFDIPQSYAGKTCSLVFLFPQLDQLETSSYSFNGKGGLAISQLSSPATQSTTFNTVPAASNAHYGSIPSLQAGNGYVVGTGSCAAGQTVSYEFSSTGGLDVNFFEDWNPSPLGAFITVC